MTSLQVTVDSLEFFAVTIKQFSIDFFHLTSCLGFQSNTPTHFELEIMVMKKVRQRGYDPDLVIKYNRVWCF